MGEGARAHVSPWIRPGAAHFCVIDGLACNTEIHAAYVLDPVTGVPTNRPPVYNIMELICQNNLYHFILGGQLTDDLLVQHTVYTYAQQPCAQ